MSARDVLKGQGTDHEKPIAELLPEYISDKIRWGAFKPPSVRTCENALRIGEAFNKAPQAAVVHEMAHTRWGRKTFFDYYTKTLILVQKTSSSANLTFVAEMMFVTMVRENKSDPTSQAELKKEAFRLKAKQHHPDKGMPLLKASATETWFHPRSKCRRRAPPTMQRPALKQVPPGECTASLGREGQKRARIVRGCTVPRLAVVKTCTKQAPNKPFKSRCCGGSTARARRQGKYESPSGDP